MSPTARTLRLALALTAASIGAAAWPPARPVVLALDAALVLAVLVDLLATPAPARAVLARDLPASVGLSQPLTRVLRVALPRRGARRVELHEEFPPTFGVRTLARDGAERAPDAAPAGEDPADAARTTALREWSPDTARTDAEGRAELRRVYVPSRRGLHTLGDVRLVVRGPLGLVERSARHSDRQEVRVEPALVGLSRTLALAASERWKDLGLRRLRRRGGETEFESLREYVPGDDTRRVDWKAFARRGVPMVRELELERGQELVLLVDRGRRMRATSAAPGGGRWSKLDFALDAALQLAAVALAKGDRVGIAAFERRLEPWVAPARGPRHLQRLAGAVFDLRPTTAEADLGRALSELAARHRRRATVVVLSDVADLLSVHEQRRALRAASRRHRLVFAALDDPDLTAAERDGRVAGRPAAPALRAAAAELGEDRRRALRALSSSGARVLDALPAALAAPLLAAWLDARHERPLRTAR